MDISLQFLGAAHCVTGSKYLLTLDGGPTAHHQLLVDYGLFQGLKELRLRNREPLPLTAAAVKLVILTHAHIDHSGYLPKLVRDGFRGRILCTETTADLLSIMLLDSAKLQEKGWPNVEVPDYLKKKYCLPAFKLVAFMLHTRRNFLQLSSVFAAVLALSSALTSCVFPGDYEAAANEVRRLIAKNGNNLHELVRLVTLPLATIRSLGNSR